MARSLKVRREQIKSVKQRVEQNGFSSQRELAERAGLAIATVSNFLTGKPVDRATFAELSVLLGLDYEAIAEIGNNLSDALNDTIDNQAIEATSVNPQVKELQTVLRQDWGEAHDVSLFYGRAEELATLQNWCIQDRCRLIAVLGMGGIGKTTLALKLADQIKGEFECVIWRSLRNTPPIDDLLTHLIQFLSYPQDKGIPETADGKIERLLHYLTQHRCLVVFDNAESIMQTCTSVGRYNPGYEGYGYLLQRIGEVSHSSCLILTSREKPKEVVLLEGTTLPVRSLQLRGLTLLDGQKIFADKGCVSTESEGWQDVFEHFSGNPLALKIVAAAAQELTDGDLAELLPYLKQGKLQFEDINDLLAQQFARLSAAEQQVMGWLAVNREFVSLAELEADLVSNTILSQLLKAVQSLNRRCLVERHGKQLSLQPVVMEYVTGRLVASICEGIEAHQQTLLRDYALVKAQSKDYIRQAQLRLILRPILDTLQNQLGSPKQVENRLKELLATSRQELPFQPGYVGGNILNLLRELNADLKHLDCSNLAIWQANLVGADLDHVSFARSDLSKSVFTETIGVTISIAFSPCGQLLATAGADGEIVLWQVSNHRKLLTCQGHIGWIWSIQFSPNGQIIASTGNDHTIRLWSSQTGECLKTLQGHSSWGLSVRFSADGQTIASAGSDHTIKLWCLQTGQCLKNLEGHEAGVWSIAFCKNGQTLVSSSDDRTIKLWDLETGECLKTLQGHQGAVYSVIVSPDGQTLASASGDTTIKLWDLETGECLRTLQGHTNTAIGVAFSPDGQKVVSSSKDCTIRIWDALHGDCLKILQGHTSRIFSIAFSPNGQTLASGSDDKTLRLWDFDTGECLKIFAGFSSGMRSVTFSPDGQALATGGGDKVVRLWDIRNYQCFQTLTGHTSWELALAFSPDGGLLASGNDDTTVKLWNVQTGVCSKTLQGHQHYVSSVAFSPNGQVLASAGGGIFVNLWDVNTGHLLKNLEGHTSRIWSVAFSPEGHILASCSYDKTIRLWDIQTGKCLRTLQGHLNMVISIAFSPSGQILASGSDDKTVRLWDMQTRECIASLQGHLNMVISIAFSPSGHILASGSDDSTIKLWDVQTGECLTTLQGHSMGVYSVAFHPNGRTLASGSQDETAKIWDLQTYECIATLRNPRPYEGMNIAEVKGLTEAQKKTLSALGAIEQ